MPLRLESLCAFTTRLLAEYFVHTYITAMLFCVKETQGRNKSLFSALFRLIFRRLTLLKFLLPISILELVQVFENSITVCHVDTPFGFVLLYQSPYVSIFNLRFNRETHNLSTELL